MKPIISFSHVTFIYPDSDTPALKNVDLEIESGSITLVIGASGSGKSTLLRCINGLVPHFSGGTLSGRIRVAELDPIAMSPQVMSQHVGFVFQDPETQFVVDRVEDEIAFALENAAIPVDEMYSRVSSIMSLLEISHLQNRHLDTLSGGERQRVAIAASLVLQPDILLLDEPTSQLDPASANELLNMLVQLKSEQQLTIVLAEHRMERILPFCDKLIYLDSNKEGVIEGEPRLVLRKITLNPPIVALGKRLNWDPLPLTTEEGRKLANTFNGLIADTAEETQHKFRTYPSNKPYIEVNNLDVWLGDKQILYQLDLQVFPGEVLVLMGSNGAGKTTLLRSLMGILKSEAGSILVYGENIKNKSVAEISLQVGYLPQDPNALLFAENVLDELLITLKNHNLNVEVYKPRELLGKLGLGDKFARYPRDLSVGERQRTALGAITVTRPGALLLDEPTRGLDYDAKQGLVQLIHGWRDEGMAILFVTHDVETAAEIADRIAIMEDGKIKCQGTPERVLSTSELFIPQIAQLFPGTGWLTPQDVVSSIS